MWFRFVREPMAPRVKAATHHHCPSFHRTEGVRLRGSRLRRGGEGEWLQLPQGYVDLPFFEELLKRDQHLKHSKA